MMTIVRQKMGKKVLELQVMNDTRSKMHDRNISLIFIYKHTYIPTHIHTYIPTAARKIKRKGKLTRAERNRIRRRKEAEHAILMEKKKKALAKQVISMYV